MEAHQWRGNVLWCGPEVARLLLWDLRLSLYKCKYFCTPVAILWSGDGNGPDEQTFSISMVEITLATLPRHPPVACGI